MNFQIDEKLYISYKIITLDYRGLSFDQLPPFIPKLIMALISLHLFPYASWGDVQFTLKCVMMFK